MCIEKVFIIVSSILSILFADFSLAATEYWLLLDSSASLTKNEAELRNETASFYSQIIADLDDNNTVGVIDFAEKIKILDPTDNITDIQRFIGAIGRSGRLTDIEKALAFFESNPSSNERKVFLFTDGKVDVAPSRCVSCEQTLEDVRSEHRIIETIIPNLSNHSPPVVVNTIGLGANVDSTFLEALSVPTGGEVDKIGNIREMFDAMMDQFDRDYRSPYLHAPGNHLRVDGETTPKIRIIGPQDLFVSPPDGSSKPKSYMMSRNQKKIIQFDDPASGTYILKSSDPDKIRIISNVEINIDDIYPSGRKNVYQYEIIPFHIALSAKNGNPTVMRKLAENNIKVDAIIDGNCKGSVKLEHTTVKGNQYWFENNTGFWMNCHPEDDQPYIFSTFFISDDANLNTVYPNTRRGLPMGVIKTDFQINIQSELMPSFLVFEKPDNLYFVGEEIKPNLNFPLPAGIISITSTEYLFDHKKIPKGTFYKISADDIGQREITVIVTCKTNKAADIKFKFIKDISIEDPPYSVAPLPLKAFAPYFPENLTIPFLNISGVPDKIKVPFTYSSKLENLELSVRANSTEYSIVEKIINAGAAQSDIQVVLNPNQLQVTTVSQVPISFYSSYNPNKPIEFTVTIKVYSIWTSIAIYLAIIVFLASATYAMVYVAILMITGTVRHQIAPCIVGKDSLEFPMRLVPPGRWELVKTRKEDGIFRLSIPPFFRGFSVNPKKCSNFYIKTGIGCDLVSKYRVKVSSEKYFRFRIVCSGQNIVVEKKRSERKN